jgi:hypothetical protein
MSVLNNTTTLESYSMRTMIQSLKACVLPDKERRYSVMGSCIVFILERNSPDRRPDLEEELDRVLRQFPWQDKLSNWSRFHPFTPVFLEESGMDLGFDDQGQWALHVCPIGHFLTRSQILPFEKFLAKLAYELSLARLRNVLLVKSSVIMTVESVHLVPPPICL